MIKQDRRELKIQAVCKQLASCVSQFDIFRSLREITETYGFRYFFVARVPGSVTGSISQAIVITSAPSELVQGYEALGLTAPNPVIALFRATGAPAELRFDDQSSPETAERQAVGDGVIDNHDFNCGFVVPVYDSERGAAVVSFIGSRPVMSACDIAELTLFGHLAHHKLNQVSAKPVKNASPLSDRERECLVWTSGGKTSVEIARILGLSEHTVNHYLNNAARKLEAVNRAQAVAFAMRQGFID